jgi:hypothetical protein
MLGNLTLVNKLHADKWNMNKVHVRNLYNLVSCSVRARKVIIKGPRGTLTRTFRHLAVDITMVNKNTVMVEKWFGKHKELAAVRTVCSHIENMIKGVTKVGHFSVKSTVLESYIDLVDHIIMTSTDLIV